MNSQDNGNIKHDGEVSAFSKSSAGNIPLLERNNFRFALRKLLETETRLTSAESESYFSLVLPEIKPTPLCFVYLCTF